MKNRNNFPSIAFFCNLFQDLERKGMFRLANLDPDAPPKTDPVSDPRDIVGCEFKTKSGWRPSRR
ncbi:MAG: hypothetical protein ABW087_17180 [Candidatus Thiodiazotropha sp.]